MTTVPTMLSERSKVPEVIVGGEGEKAPGPSMLGVAVVVGAWSIHMQSGLR